MVDDFTWKWDVVSFLVVLAPFVPAKQRIIILVPSVPFNIGEHESKDKQLCRPTTGTLNYFKCQGYFC